MGLSYYFTFAARQSETAGELKAFLQQVEKAAHEMGFGKTLVLDAPFDTPERREFARRLTPGFYLEDERLKGVSVPATPGIWEHNQIGGSCHVLPEHGVILVITDEHGAEMVFGFYRYPESIKDIHGRILADTKLAGAWHFTDFVDTPDPRIRKIVSMFAEKGFLHEQKDEFHPTA